MSDDQPIASEDDLIERFLRPLAAGNPAALELRDDTACLSPREGMDVVLTKDALVGGVHFFPSDRPKDIGIKAVTVNLSDLIAKGAQPVGYLLALALPRETDASWVEGFTSGFGEQAHGKLLGGDLTRTDGPLVVTVTAIGEVPRGTMVRRATAQPGDHLYVSGPIGTSVLGLRYVQDPGLAKRHALDAEGLRELVRVYMAPMIPFPDLVADLVRDFASASMDVSDGLVIDLKRMCAASSVGAELDAADVPLNPVVRALLASGHVDQTTLLTGGDDYCALIAVSAARRDAFEAAVAESLATFHRIGQITDRSGELVVRDGAGQTMVVRHIGHDHFRASS